MRAVRFILATLAFIVLASVLMAVGHNTGYNGTFNWDTFGDSFFGMFGGFVSFLALLGVIFLLAVAYFAVLRLAQQNRNSAAAGLGVTLVVIALVIGATWINIDLAFFGGIWPVLLYFVFAAIATAIIGAILGAVSIRRRTSTTTTTN